MKKLMIAATMIVGIAFMQPAAAQVQVNVNINSQPLWGPTGYDYVQYYYFPDIEVYYDVPARRYVYLNGNSWTRVRTLPARYSSFNVYDGYKVVINEKTPYLRHDVYRMKYVTYKGKRSVPVIRDSHEEKYYVVKGHPDHGKYKGGKEKGKGNGKGKGHGKH